MCHKNLVFLLLLYKRSPFSIFFKFTLYLFSTWLRSGYNWMIKINIQICLFPKLVNDIGLFWVVLKVVEIVLVFFYFLSYIVSIKTILVNERNNILAGMWQLIW